MVCGVVFTALTALYFLIALMGAAINSDIDEGKTQEFADVVKDAGYAIPDAEGSMFRIRLSEKSAVLMVLFPESAEDPSDLEAIRGQQPIRFRIRSRDAEAFGNGEAVEVVELSVAGDPVITLESYNRCRGERNSQRVFADGYFCAGAVRRDCRGNVFCERGRRQTIPAENDGIRRSGRIKEESGQGLVTDPARSLYQKTRGASAGKKELKR